MTSAEAERGACLVCGISHRYQWPNGSDASGHEGSYVACVNSLKPVADLLFEVEGELRERGDGRIPRMLEDRIHRAVRP